ncbi:MAG: NirD/YgiW/YdeI family stress tolerance protein [Pasteurellaceae bacterium]|nr:NirD/YgiW/YdeI family stress tolerance protein [Pasteurellaceae bacterium]
MKKYLTLSILFGTVALTACQSEQPQQQVFGANLPTHTMSVQQALSARDDSYVTLEGKILSQIDDDEYLFGDATGQIRVEIDQHIWRGQNVTTQNKLRLYGEIDKEWNKTELKVRELTVLQ